MESHHYDAVVVGAGPAGSSAALTMAQENMSVCLIERGAAVGSKKLFGGTIHRAPIDEIVPAFWEEAPVERPVVSDELWILDNTSAVKVGFTGLSYAKPPYNKFTVLRYKWDNWLAKKAEQAGAHLMTGTLVKDLIYKPYGVLGHKVCGVVLDNEEKLYAHVVILAEGASAAVTDKARLRKQIKPEHISLQTIELMHMSPEKIEERFQLEKNEGMVIGMIGYPSSGKVGKGGIWIQNDTIALTVGGYLNHMIEGGQSPYQQLKHLKEHPLVKRVLAGAETIAYGCHTIPKGGFNSLPHLSSHGVMIVGDAAGFISGRRGTDLAMFSGKYAGETAAQAHALGQYTVDILKAYDNKLAHSFFYKDMKDASGMVDYFHTYKDSDYLITKSANELAYEFFRIGLETKKEKIKKMKEEALGIQPLLKSVEDIYEGIQHWGFF